METNVGRADEVVTQAEENGKNENIEHTDDSVRAQTIEMQRVSVASPLTCKQRLILFHETAIPPEERLTMKDADITYDLLYESGVKWQCLSACSLPVRELKARGFATADQLKAIGMDALDLVDVAFCQQLVRVYGASAISRCFLNTPSDVIALSGTRSMNLLGVGVDRCLELCAGEPLSATEYLKHVPDLPTSIKDTSIARLLDCGLSARSLSEVGVSLHLLVETFKATPRQLQNLGFDVSLCVRNQ